MGRGNVCVTGSYEGLFYIDNDDLRVYSRNAPPRQRGGNQLTARPQP